MNYCTPPGSLDVQAYPEAHSPAEVLGAHVFLARMPATQGAQQLAGADAFKEEFAARSLATGANGRERRGGRHRRRSF